MKLINPPIPNDTNLILARSGELFLKGRNQSRFVDRLKQNLRASLRQHVGNCQIKGSRGHLFIHLESAEHLLPALHICANTPGFTSFSPVYRVPADVDVIREKALGLATTAWSGQDISFAVRSKRVDKRFPTSSQEMNQEVGGAIFMGLNLRVDLTNPDETLGIKFKHHPFLPYIFGASALFLVLLAWRKGGQPHRVAMADMGPMSTEAGAEELHSERLSRLRSRVQEDD